MIVTDRPHAQRSEDQADQPPATAPTDNPEALIEEARRRARRRRLTWATVLIAAATAAALGYAFTGGQSPRSPGSTHGRAPSGVATVRSVNLSRFGGYESLALVDGRLILSGGPDGSLFPSASIAASPHWHAATRCWSAVVNPDTLQFTRKRLGSCDNPALYGVRVLPVNFVDNGGHNDSTVRIARITGRGSSVGPVVMRYSEASDTNAEWMYGDGFLWIYDPSTTQGSELLQISPQTGAVLDRFAMPMISRLLMAANADGLWLIPAVTSGWSGHPARALYHVTPGARQPQIAVRNTMLARWIIADGHSVWVDVTHSPKQSTLWRFDGPSARPAFHRSLAAALDYGEFGYGEPGYAGGADGIWAVVPSSGQSVIRIDPEQGTVMRMATIHPQAAYTTDSLQPPLVVLHGAAFFLDPPTPSGTYPYRRRGFSALYRVTATRHAG